MNTHSLNTRSLNSRAAETTVAKRDDLVLRDIRARLAAMGYFHDVKLGRMPREFQAANDRSAYAWVKRTSWTEEKISAEYDKLHVAEFSIWLVVVGRDEFERSARLMQIEEAAHQAIENQCLADFCLPAWTTLRRGRDLPEGDMRSGTELLGSFRYIHEDSRKRALFTP